MTKIKTDKCLIIIGNGFDLAHEAPTSYIHFSDWLLKDFINKYYRVSTKEIEDDYISSYFAHNFASWRKTKHHSHELLDSWQEATATEDKDLHYKLLTDNHIFLTSFF